MASEERARSANGLRKITQIFDEWLASVCCPAVTGAGVLDLFREEVDLPPVSRTPSVRRHWSPEGCSSACTSPPEFRQRAVERPGCGDVGRMAAQTTGPGAVDDVTCSRSQGVTPQERAFEGQGYPGVGAGSAR